MALPPELLRHLQLSGNEDIVKFAKDTWQQLEDHAAQGPDQYRKFQEATLSTAMGNTRPDALSNRQAVLMIETSILSSGSSMLVTSAQLTIRIYQAFPSLADSMSGSLTRNRGQVAVTQPAAHPKILWQSEKLTANTKGAIILDVECSAKALDAVLVGASMSNRASLMQQVLQHLELQSGVKLASKSAKLSVLRPLPDHANNQKEVDRHEDLSNIPAVSARLPASLLSKLSLVGLERKDSPGSGSNNNQQPASKDTPLSAATSVRRRPLIQEM